MYLKRLLPILFLVFSSYIADSQIDIGATNRTVLLKHEKSGFLQVHTQGWGVGYRSGKFVTAFKRRFLEAELLGMKHPKETKIANDLYSGARSFYYGKLNSLFLSRIGFGSQKLLNEKPYWGGVEVRFIRSIGFSGGITKPVYLYVIKEVAPPQKFQLNQERYDPEIHEIDMIYGRGNFFKGFEDLGFYPGGYLKLGLSFEYGSENESVRALEAGVIADIYPKGIPVMAKRSADNYFFTFYLSLHIGKRYN